MLVIWIGLVLGKGFLTMLGYAWKASLNMPDLRRWLTWFFVMRLSFIMSMRKQWIKLIRDPSIAGLLAKTHLGYFNNYFLLLPNMSPTWLQELKSISTDPER
jgi:hypothetical protein